MKFALLLLLYFLPQGEETKAPVSEKEKDSYVLGYQMGKGVRTQGVEIDLDQFLAGVTDGMENTPKLTEDQIIQLYRDFQRRMRQRTIDRNKDLASKNLIDAQLYLDQNGKRTGVVTTSSGLQYKVMKEGTGPKPANLQTKIKVHYRGFMLNGVEFDNTMARNEPATFQLDAVIDGWSEGLLLMSRGSKYMFWVPPELGYGTNVRAGSKIEPNALLMFEVELLEILP
ncbi:MAG: FKBP-type peptidyl-prolyl cis-trans isomerase [Acidobacteriota bacterium]|nr:FKBP-type peptidyl-prolyl cis-trans isomerase [Acidobacteriota bacterium]